MRSNYNVWPKYYQRTKCKGMWEYTSTCRTIQTGKLTERPLSTYAWHWGSWTSRVRIPIVFCACWNLEKGNDNNKIGDTKYQVCNNLSDIKQVLTTNKTRYVMTVLYLSSRRSQEKNILPACCFYAPTLFASHSAKQTHSQTYKYTHIDINCQILKLRSLKSLVSLMSGSKVKLHLCFKFVLLQRKFAAFIFNFFFHILL